MRYRQLGNSQHQVSVIGLGCIQLGDRADLAASRAIVHRALDLGINFFDTANVYSDGTGEEVLGKALGPRRKDVVLASKVGRVRMGPHRKLVRDSSPREIRAGIEASLRRLGTDWIDHYQLHWPDPDIPFADSLGVMQELQKEGKIRSIGICNFAGRQVTEAHVALPSLATVQSPYSMLRRALEIDTFPYCVHHGIGVLPYWPLEQGVLSGRYTLKTPPPSASPSTLRQIEAVDRMRPFAEGIGRSLPQLALCWLLSRAGVAAVIPGASRVEQIEHNCAAGDWSLQPDEVFEIDRILTEASPGARTL
jgi:aryl-alcohol dehydrogenase-like predicted oxidoreductase